MLTVSDINSTLDNSDNTQTPLKINTKLFSSEFILYDESIIVNSPILHPYVIKKINNFEERFKRLECIYSLGLTPTSIFFAIDNESNEHIVIKELKKSKLLTSYMHEFARNELAIHYSLSNYTKCDNIVKVKDYFEDSRAYFMVMECSSDPNFFEDLLENKFRPISNEGILKAYSLDILNGLIEIHKNNIIHCDIKPQNFLLFHNEDEKDSSLCSPSFDDMSISSYDSDSFLKITDFGLSHLIPFGQTKAFMKYRCGTFGYSAPEVGKNSLVDTSIDMWSFGLCLYQMAVAYLPSAIKQYKYGIGPIPFRKIDWNVFNFENIKNLIQSCLQVEPEKRITALEAINHPWFELD